MAAKTELKLTPHSGRGLMGVPSDANTLEIHYDGKLIGTVVGADGPGVRIISKHKVTMPLRQPQVLPGFPVDLNVLEITIHI